MNKESGYKKQFLYSYKLKFDFVTDAQSLNYLNGKQFEVNNVWFKDAFLKGELWFDYELTIKLANSACQN